MNLNKKNMDLEGLFKRKKDVGGIMIGVLVRKVFIMFV